MKHPHDNFLRARILCRKSREEILTECNQLGLHLVGDYNAHYSELRRQVCAHAPSIQRYVMSRAKKAPKLPSANVLQRALLDPRMVSDPEDPDIEGAAYITGHPAIRELVEVLLLHGEGPNRIADELEHHFHLSDMGTKVAAYSFYYWNTDGMMPSEFQMWLNQVPEKEMPVHRMAMYQDVDSVRAFLGLSITADLSRIADNAVSMAMAFFHRLAKEPMAHLSDDCRAWSREVSHLIKTAADTRIAAQVQSSEDARSILEQVSVELQETDHTAGMRTQADLAQENHKIIPMPSSQKASS